MIVPGLKGLRGANVQLEVRSAETGEVLFRDQLPKPVVDISVADFRNDGTKQVLVCLANGELRGYITVDVAGLSKPVQEEHDLKLQEQVRVQTLGSPLHKFAC